MKYEEAKQYKEELDAINREHSKVLQKFETINMGLVPDHIRATPEWEKAKQDYDHSFAELRKFNAWFVKEFRKKKKQKKTEV